MNASQAAIPDSEKLIIQQLTKTYFRKNYKCYYDLITLKRMVKHKNTCLYLIEIGFKTLLLHATTALASSTLHAKFLNELIQLLNIIIDYIDTNFLSKGDAKTVIDNITRSGLCNIHSFRAIKHLVKNASDIIQDNTELLNQICVVLHKCRWKNNYISAICVDLAAHYSKPKPHEYYQYFILYNLVLYRSMMLESTYQIINNICVHYMNSDVNSKRTIDVICKIGIKNHFDDLLYASDSLKGLRVFPKHLWKKYATFSMAIELGLYNFDAKMFVFMLKNVSIHMVYFKRHNCNTSTCLIWPFVKYLEIFTEEELFIRLGCLAHFGVIDCLQYIISLPVFWKNCNAINRHIRFLRSHGVEG